jgi:hypothetical protein
MTRIIATLFVLTLAACSGERIVYVYPDAGPVIPGADAGPSVGDGSSPLPDGPVVDVDAHEPAPGECYPDRFEGEVSSADCHRYASTPVCDGTTSTCTALPRHYCGACETDAQCAAGVDIRADCVFLPRPAPYPSDQACLSPCDVDADCAFLPQPEWTGVQCVTLERGRYCVVPFSTGEPTCSDFMGGRRGDGV